MATSPAGKRPAPKKTIPTKKPAATKKAVGIAAPKAKAPAKTKTSTTKLARKPVVKPAAKAVPKAKAKPKAKNAINSIASITHESIALTDLQSRFVDEYLIDLNATQAAIRAGYSVNAAAEIGYENLIKPQIASEIQHRKQERQQRTEITADAVLREVWNMFRADPRELVEVRVGCCRHCYGEGHKRQRTVGEMNAAREKWIDEGKVPLDFDEEGGIGFNPLLQPHPHCPECGGNGHARTVLHDTRNLSPQAASLYAGAKETKYGIEVQMHDRVAIAEKMFKHLGMYAADNAQKGIPLLVNSTVTFVEPPARAPEDDEGDEK